MEGGAGDTDKYNIDHMNVQNINHRHNTRYKISDIYILAPGRMLFIFILSEILI